MSPQKPREIAARVLMERLQASDYTEDLLARALAGKIELAADRSLIHELVCGVVRRQATLDRLIQRKAKRNASSRVQILLRLGLYQLFWLDRIPAFAAINETVALARRFGLHAEAGFVNAVLRAYAREQDATRALIKDLQEHDPAVGFSHPKWLLDRWLARWDQRDVKSLLHRNNSTPSVYARMNALKTTSLELERLWHDEGVEAVCVDYPWISDRILYELRDWPALSTLSSMQKGCFYIQDPSTLLAVTTLNPQPGEHVLDLCAAPGGKTTFMAQLMGNRGSILALDNRADRLDLLRENCRRLGVTCVQTGLVDDHPALSGTNRFDKILIDAPCTNTGVLQRRIDVRWRINPAELNRLVQVQQQLLARAGTLLKPGGVVVYSTCSLEPEENHEVTAGFLREHDDFHLEAERELLPFRDGVDGAYCSKLIRDVG